MKNKKYLSMILPQKSPMILIDKVLCYSLKEKWLKSSVCIDEKSIFFDKDINGIDGVIGFEFIAQSIGCYVYFKNNCKIPNLQYMLSTKLYNNGVTKFKKGKTYYVYIKEVFVDEVYFFDCLIYNSKYDEIASATINIYQNY